MKKIDLENDDFRDDSNYWANKNLNWSILVKLIFDSFKDNEFCAVSDIFEDLRGNRCLTQK